MEELYREGKVQAIGVCNFYQDCLLDLCYNVEITPQINQIERHPHRGKKILRSWMNWGYRPRYGRPLQKV